MSEENPVIPAPTAGSTGSSATGACGFSTQKDAAGQESLSAVQRMLSRCGGSLLLHVQLLRLSAQAVVGFLHLRYQLFSFGIGRSFAKYGGAHLPDEFIECDTILEFARIAGTFLLRWDEAND